MANDQDEARRRAKQWLIEMIRELEDIEPPPGWEERAMERWRRGRSRYNLGMKVDLEALERLAHAATDGAEGRWEVSTSNGTITSYNTKWNDHASTVAFAVRTDDEFSRIDIDERNAAYIAAAGPATVLALITRIRELETVPPPTWRALSDEQRLELMGMCCRGCGSLEPPICYCERDD